MHDLYDNTRQLFGSQQLSWLTCNPKIYMLGQGYTPSLSDTRLSDVPAAARLVAPIALTGVSLDRGIARCDPVTVGPAFSGLYATAMLLFASGVDDNSALLIAHYANVLGLPSLIPAGGTILTWDAINGAFKV